MFVASGMTTMFLHQYFHRVFRVGMWMKSALLAAVYTKSVKLTGSARGDKTIGEM